MVRKWLETIFSKKSSDRLVEMERYKSHVYHHFNRPDYYEYLNKKLTGADALPAEGSILWQQNWLPACGHWSELSDQTECKLLKKFSSLAGKGHQIRLFTFQMGEKHDLPAMMDIHSLYDTVFWVRILYPRFSDIARIEWLSAIQDQLNLKNPGDLYQYRFALPDGSSILYEDARNVTVHIRTPESEVLDAFLAGSSP